jgi:hypothetical protein
MDESYDIAHSWLEALSSSLALANFCQDNFGKAPTIWLGYPMTDKPGQQIAPYVVVIPVKDSGGFEVAASVSTVLVGLGLVDKETEAVGDAVEHRGYKTARLFEKAVLEVLGATAFPPSSWDGETAQPGHGYFERQTFYEIEQARTI